MRPERFTVPVAVHVFLVRDGRVLLLLRKNTGYEDGRYSVPAGHLEGGESVTQAAVREVGEEAGVAVATADLRFAGVMNRRGTDERIDFFFAVESWSGDIRNCEPERCGGLDWFAFEALPEKVVPYVRQALTNYRAGVPFQEFGWA